MKFQGMTKLAPLIVAVLLTTTVHASLSEIKEDFLNQTTLLPATQLLTPGASAGSYWICVYVSQPHSVSNNGSYVPMTAVLRWTDENGKSQSQSASSAVDDSFQYCYSLIRNRALTAPTIGTDGAVSGPYNLFVIGLGFWTTGSQKQGGLTEPLSQEIVSQNAGATIPLLQVNATGTYLFNATCCQGSGVPGDYATLQWTDEQGAQSTLLASTTAMYGTTIPVHAVGGSTISLYLPQGQSTAPFYVNAVLFGEPLAGPGPLTDYEDFLLDWTNATWPYHKTFVSTPGGLVFAVATNIAERPNTSAADEQLDMSVNFSGLTFLPTPALPAGAPAEGRTYFTAYAPASSSDLFFWETYNTPGTMWGDSPTYSAEIVAVSF